MTGGMVGRGSCRPTVCNCTCPEPNLVCKFDASMCPVRTKVVSSVCSAPVQQQQQPTLVNDTLFAVQADRLMDNLTIELADREGSVLRSIERNKNEISVGMKLAADEIRKDVLKAINVSEDRLEHEIGQACKVLPVVEISKSEFSELKDKMDGFTDRLDRIIQAGSFVLHGSDNDTESGKTEGASFESELSVKILLGLDTVMDMAKRILTRLQKVEKLRATCNIPNNWLPPQFFFKHPVAFFLYGSLGVNTLLLWMLIMACFLLTCSRKKKPKKTSVKTRQTGEGGVRKRKTRSCGCCQAVKRKVYFMKKKFRRSKSDRHEEKEMDLVDQKESGDGEDGKMIGVRWKKENKDKVELIKERSTVAAASDAEKDSYLEPEIVVVGR